MALGPDLKKYLKTVVRRCFLGKSELEGKDLKILVKSSNIKIHKIPNYYFESQYDLILTKTKNININHNEMFQLLRQQ